MEIYKIGPSPPDVRPFSFPVPEGVDELEDWNRSELWSWSDSPEKNISRQSFFGWQSRNGGG
jgi:hypothetical protein